MERLRAEGRRLRVFPYSVQWLAEPSLDVPCQVLVIAPKRKLHHAVDRNRVKRLTRECYRLRKEPLFQILTAQGRHITLSLVYLHDSPMTYEQLSHRFDKLMDALLNDLQHENPVQGTEVVAG